MALIRKIRLPGRVKKKIIPRRVVLANVGQLTCPHCFMVLPQWIEQDERGNCTNYDPETMKMSHKHPPSSVCPLGGRLLRWAMTQIVAEVLN